MVVDHHDEGRRVWARAGYEPDERGQYTDMPDPSKSPQFLMTVQPVGLRGLSQECSGVTKDEDKLYRIWGGGRRGSIGSMCSACDVVENEDGI